MTPEIRNKRRLNKLRHMYPTMNERPACYAVIQNYKGSITKQKGCKRFMTK